MGKVKVNGLRRATFTGVTPSQADEVVLLKKNIWEACLYGGILVSLVFLLSFLGILLFKTHVPALKLFGNFDAGTMPTFRRPHCADLNSPLKPAG